jgi:hypothetical protein
MHGAPADLARWWLRDIKGRPVSGSRIVESLARTEQFPDGVTDEGLWYHDTMGSTGLRTWPQVHQDLGESFLRESRTDRDVHPGPDLMDHLKAESEEEAS